MEERPPRVGVDERAEAAPHHAEVGARAKACAAEELRAAIDGPSQARRAEPGKDDLGAGQGGRAQDAVELAAEAPARHEDETLDHLGKQIRELHRHATAERMADERDASLLEADEKIADHGGVRAGRVLRVWLGRLTVAQEVRRDHREVLREQGDDLFPRLGAARDSVQEHERRSATGHAVAEGVTVQRDLEDGEGHGVSLSPRTSRANVPVR